MVGWIILGVFVALLLLILFLPVGADIGFAKGPDVGCEQAEYHLSAKAGALTIRLLPKDPEKEAKPKKEKKPKKKKEKKKTEDGEAAEEKPRKKLEFTFDELLDLLRAALKGFKKFGRAWKVDRFLLHLVVSGEDPYNTAMTYGYVNAALSSLAPLCRRRYAVRDCSVATDVNFVTGSMSVELGLAMTVTLWRLLGAVNAVLFGALRILIRNRIRLWKEKRERKKNGPEEDQNIEIHENEPVQEEERMAANG